MGSPKGELGNGDVQNDTPLARALDADHENPDETPGQQQDRDSI